MVSQLEFLLLWRETITTETLTKKTFYQKAHVQFQGPHHYQQYREHEDMQKEAVLVAESLPCYMQQHVN